jgi:hypothetical protein
MSTTNEIAKREEICTKLKLLCDIGYDGWYEDYLVYDGAVYVQLDTLHDVDDNCGCCWARVDISLTKTCYYDSDSDSY